MFRQVTDCIMADRKNYFQKVISCFEERNICILLVEYSELLTGINLKRYCRNSFLQNYKNNIVFCTSDGAKTPNLVPHKISLLKYLLLLLLMQASIILYQFQFLMKSCIISLVVNNVAVIEMGPEKAFVYGEQCKSW